MSWVISCETSSFVLTCDSIIHIGYEEKSITEQQGNGRLELRMHAHLDFIGLQQAEAWVCK